MAAKRIAFIGLGGMGSGIACRLAESGSDVTVHNRTRSKTAEAERLGATVADSAGEAAATADVVMLSLSDQHVVDAALTDDGGVFARLAPGGYIVDMTTVQPDFARDLARRGSALGFHVLDACVLGNPFHARSGELRVMVGGSDAAFAELEPIFAMIGKEVTHLGGNGMGATMKLVLNMLMGVQMPALAEAVVFGERAGLPRDKILQMVAGSGYASPVMTFRCSIMENRNFDFAAFKLRLMRKDMLLVLDAAQGLGVPLPVSETAYSMLTAATQQGLGDLDVAAMLAFQERLAGVEGYPWPGDSGAAASA